jgi:hypothetical protein
MNVIEEKEMKTEARHKNYKRNKEVRERWRRRNVQNR